MKRETLPEAIFFDVGETLVAPHPSFAAVFAGACRREGVAISDAAAHAVETWVAREHAAWRAQGKRFSTSPGSSRRFWQGAYGQFLAEAGIAFPASLPERIYARFLECAAYRAFPDVAPALQALRERGFLLGVISNWEDWLERLLDELGLLPYFRVVVVSGVEGREKPEPALFERALARLGVPPARALHVGDSPESDCAAALTAGMDAVLIDRRGCHRHSPYRRIADLAELVQLLERDFCANHRV